MIRQRNPEQASQAMIEHIVDVEEGMLSSKGGSMIITEKGLLKH